MDNLDPDDHHQSFWQLIDRSIALSSQLG